MEIVDELTRRKVTIPAIMAQLGIKIDCQYVSSARESEVKNEITKNQMIRSFKLFASCVESMRKAEREYQVKPDPAAKSIMVDLQKKVDEWLEWIKAQEDAELTKVVPPFVHKPQSSSNKMFNQKINQQLLANHTLEEIERFFNSMQG